MACHLDCDLARNSPTSVCVWTAPACCLLPQQARRACGGGDHTTVTHFQTQFATPAAPAGDESVRWKATAEELGERMLLLVGDVFLSAACISYTGAFTGECVS